MAMTPAEKQAAYRERQRKAADTTKARIAELEHQQQKPSPFADCTPEEVDWLRKLLVERRNAPAKNAERKEREAAGEAELQARRLAQWDKATRTAPLFRSVHVAKFESKLEPVENRVLSATRKYVKGIYRHYHTGRLELFTISYSGQAGESSEDGRWFIRTRGLELPAGAMEAAGYRAEAPQTEYPWNKPRPFKDMPDADLRKLRSHHHPDRNKPDRDPAIYQQAVEEVDRRRTQTPTPKV